MREFAEEVIMGKMPGKYNTRTWGRSYLSRLQSIQPLNSRQELHLFRQMSYCKWRAKTDETWKNKHLPARDILIQANMRLVFQVAKKSRSEDLISEATFALIKAVDDYRYDGKLKFNDFARYRLNAFFRNNNNQKKLLPDFIDSYPLCTIESKYTIDSLISQIDDEP
jgi:DNA-directed RNA polymerase sigma subunit (sigma70/sigma32)